MCICPPLLCIVSTHTSYYHGATYQLTTAKVGMLHQAASAAFEAINVDLEAVWCTAEVLSEIAAGTFDRTVPAKPVAPAPGE